MRSWKELFRSRRAPEIEAANPASDQPTPGSPAEPIHVAGRFIVIVSFQPKTLYIQLASGAEVVLAIRIPCEQDGSLLEKAMRFDFREAGGVIAGEDIEALANRCVEIQERFAALIRKGGWRYDDAAFRQETLLPIVARSLDRWTRPQFSYRELAISFSAARADA